MATASGLMKKVLGGAGKGAAKIVFEICPRSLLESGALCYLILQKKSEIAEGFALK